MSVFEDDEARDAFKAKFLRLTDAHEHLMGYVRETVLSQPGYVCGDHIATICETIERFLQSDRRGLAISMPPRHMKSTIGAECLPAWWLSNHPQGEVIIASYNQTQARKMARACRQRFDGDMHRMIFGKAEFSVDAADELQLRGKLNGRPSLIAAGVGAGLTGSGGDLVIIDDPVKDMEEAESETIRDKVYDWYTSVASTRLSPGGHIILIMTRWHHDDLAGRILRDDAENWDVLNLPAISDDGRALWPERFPVEDLMSKKAAMGSRVFEALYQGRPTPLEGGMFRRDWIRYGEPLGSRAYRCRYWDKAATHGGGDWTSGTLMSMQDGRYVIEDIVRIQGSPAEVEELIRATAERDGRQVRIRMEQEPGSSGVDVIDHYARHVLRGYDFRPDKVTGNKQLRAEAMAAAMECGNVSLVTGRWNRDFVEELMEFPLGAHDDQVDSTSGAFNELALNAGSKRIRFVDLRPLFINRARDGIGMNIGNNFSVDGDVSASGRLRGGGQAVAEGDAPLLDANLKIPEAFLPGSSGQTISSLTSSIEQVCDALQGIVDGTHIFTSVCIEGYTDIGEEVGITVSGGGSRTSIQLPCSGFVDSNPAIYVVTDGEGSIEVTTPDGSSYITDISAAVIVTIDG